MSCSTLRSGVGERHGEDFSLRSNRMTQRKEGVEFHREKQGCSESDCNGRDILLNCGNIDRKLNFNLYKQ